MALRVVPTELGPPAFAALAREVRAAKHGEPLAPCTVLVPSNSLGVSVRRRLASGEAGPVCGDRPGLVGVTFLTVYRLAELLAAAPLAARGLRPVSTPVVLAAIGQELDRRPGFFEPVAGHPATDLALLRSYRELREVDEEDLRRLAARSHRASEVVRICRAVHERLRGEWYDEADLMAAARARVEGAPGVPGDVGTVVAHLPGETTPTAASLLAAVARTGDLVVVAGRSGAPSADAPVDRLLLRLDAAPPATAAAAPLATGLLHAADADDEVRTAVRLVTEALHRDPPVPLERMAVLFSTPDPYAPLLREHLTAAGLRHQGHVGRPLAHSLAGRALLSMLRRAAADDPVRRDLLVAELGSVPWRGFTGGVVPAARWEQRSRELGVVGGLGRWREAVAAATTELDARAADLEPLVEAGEEEPGRLVGIRARRDDLADLLAHVEADAAELSSLARAGTWPDLVAGCRRRLRRVLPPRADDDGGVEQRAVEAVDRVLDAAAGLGAVDEPASVATLLQLVDAELERPTRRGGLGDGLLVGPLGAAAGLDLDLVVLVGLAEGDLPGRPVEDSLLLDSERAAVGDALRPSRARTEQRHLDLLHAVAAGREVVLGWPRGDLRRSAQRLPSRWVLEQARRLGAEEGLERVAADALDQVTPTPGWIRECRSFAGGLADLRLPAHDQEYRLAAVARTGSVPVGPTPFHDAHLARSVELVHARASERLTRFDGVLPRGMVPSPLSDDAVVSPTNLEAWRKCPNAYLLTRVLGVQPVEEPEDRLEIDPRERGTILHDVLEEWLGEHLDDPPAPGTPWSDRDLHRLEQIAERHFEEARRRGVTGRPLLWEFERERLLRILRATAARDDARRAAGGLTPLRVELAFGSRRDPLEVPLPSGRTLRLLGRIDRVDATPGGGVAVADYKSGGSSRWPAFDPDDPTDGGARLQLPLYALAASRVLDRPLDDATAEYWFLRDQKHRSLRVGPEVVDGALSVIDRLVEMMERGLFVALPKAPDTSPYVDCDCCDPDALGTGDAHRRWNRKRSDPIAADLVALIDGPAPADEEDR